MEEYALFTSALERVNAFVDDPSLELCKLSEFGGMIHGNCDGFVETQRLDTQQTDFDYLFVFAQLDGKLDNQMRVTAYLNRLHRSNCVVGAVGGAVIALAQIGILGQERLAVHWQRRDVYTELSISSVSSDKLCETDGKHWTSCGQTSALDLALHLIADVFGASTAIELAQQFIHSRLYDRHATQNEEVLQAAITGSECVNRAINIFRENIENPVGLRVLAKTMGISLRQLERKFTQHCGTTPSRYYKNLRLTYARNLVLQTTLPLSQVALAAGFYSASSLSLQFRKKYDESPSHCRRKLRFAYSERVEEKT